MNPHNARERLFLLFVPILMVAAGATVGTVVLVKLILPVIHSTIRALLP